MMQTLFPAEDGIFHDDNAPIYTVGLVQSWFDEQGDEFKHLPWPAESPDLNIMKQLRSILYPSNGIDILYQHLCQKFYNIFKRNMVQYSSKHYSALVHGSIPRRIQAVSHAKGGTTPY
ncbi:DDE_3 domain-containing protein [Trichonephila clavipes]|nr:DDE_3 domain-containing protein [Trichonephila clavipes]